MISLKPRRRTQFSSWRSKHHDAIEQAVKVAQITAKLYPRDSGGFLDLQKIINKEGIKLLSMPVDKASEKASGQFVFDEEKDGPIIYVNTTMSPAHQRFTIAHELGHYFLKHGTSMRDLQNQVSGSCTKEVAANNFAAELLMPADDMIKYYKKFQLSKSELAKRFGVSEIAIEHRLKNLNLEN